MAPSVVLTLNMVTTIPSSSFASGNESANVASSKNGVVNLSSHGQDLLLAFNIVMKNFKLSYKKWARFFCLHLILLWKFFKCCAKITEGCE
jgi:hypothetical protein